MARPIDDDGHCLVATKPFRPGRRVYAPDKLPDPVQCAGCLIEVNDRHDASRLRMAMSDGSSWRFVAFADEAQVAAPSRAVDLAPQVDVSALAREAIATVLPTMLAPQPRVIEHAASGEVGRQIAALQQADKITAEAFLELTGHVNRLLNENAELMARVEFLERHAIGEVKTRDAA